MKLKKNSPKALRRRRQAEARAAAAQRAEEDLRRAALRADLEAKEARRQAELARLRAEPTVPPATGPVPLAPPGGRCWSILSLGGPF